MNQMKEDIQTDSKSSFGKHAARASIIVPVIAKFLGDAIELHSLAGELIVRGTQFTLYLAGFVLAAIVLCRLKKYGREGVLGWAVSGLIFNGLIIVLVISIIPSMPKVRKYIAETTGYSVKQMQAMPEVIPNSTKIINRDIGFRLEIPSDFQVCPVEDNSIGHMYGYQRIGDDGTVVVISIRRLNGTIGREEINENDVGLMKSMLPSDARFRLTKQNWNCYELSTIVMNMKIEGETVCSLGVQIPLAKEAIQIELAGSVEAEKELFELLRQLLISLKGKSNWPTDL